MYGRTCRGVILLIKTTFCGVSRCRLRRLISFTINRQIHTLTPSLFTHLVPERQTHEWRDVPGPFDRHEQQLSGRLANSLRIGVIHRHWDIRLKPDWFKFQAKIEVISWQLTSFHACLGCQQSVDEAAGVVLHMRSGSDLHSVLRLFEHLLFPESRAAGPAFMLDSCGQSKIMFEYRQRFVLPVSQRPVSPFWETSCKNGVFTVYSDSCNLFLNGRWKGHARINWTL